MNGHQFEKGCKGAVWADGKASKPYCSNTGQSFGRFSWWASCCQWKGSTCLPKPLKKGKFDKSSVRLITRI